MIMKMVWQKVLLIIVVISKKSSIWIKNKSAGFSKNGDNLPHPIKK